MRWSRNSSDAAASGRLSSLVWLIPLAAAFICAALAYQSVSRCGPAITISFLNAEGLEAGKAAVKYRDVEIGSVEAVTLAPDRSHVLAKVRLTEDARRFAVKGTRFWVVRPRVDAGGISGLGTVLSGAYIGVAAGHSRETETHFTGLETPSAVRSDDEGARYVLHGESLGSVDVGSPVYYRRVQVGRISGVTLDKKGTGVALDVFVDRQYQQYVGTNTRWWQASGLDLRLDANGLTLNTQSLAAVMLGGIAFQTPPGESIGPAAPDGAAFPLAQDETRAMRHADGPAAPVVMKFTQSLRGLTVGAPVDFRGIQLGEVTRIGVEFDARTREFTLPVTLNLYPDRLGRRYLESVQHGDTNAGKALLLKLVASGLRGQLRTGNLLTNQLYVALDMFPTAPPAHIDLNVQPIELPTVPNTLEELQVQIADIAKQLAQVPFDQLSHNLNEALQNADRLLGQLDTQLAPQARGTLASAEKTFNAAHAVLQQDSPMQTDLHEALTKLTQTLRSLNALGDYLERHPESLVWGKAKSER
ncbi:intermembrane transport protein PqiB [Paraburkholderia sp. BL21I4N1]|uniref:PqiB family protein n=1 Tax=Paraburkholderia sp. BL21I4N1 TaxID=1938801 RepID=UPI000CFC97DC|nr:MlaD family protein [Paraburkholderia sp. BL21I4N1]PQV54044.1 paraquat-inducible protein B [Paraburkholderia sp. BL21I4N1]